MLEIIKKMAELEKLKSIDKFQYCQLRVDSDGETAICIIDDLTGEWEELEVFDAYNESEIIKALDKLISEARDG